jgi:hypothetical protein
MRMGNEKSGFGTVVDGAISSVRPTLLTKSPSGVCLVPLEPGRGNFGETQGQYVEDRIHRKRCREK